MKAYTLDEMRLIISRLKTVSEVNTLADYIHQYKKDYPLMNVYEFYNKIKKRLTELSNQI